jgi:hypothetical protein
MTGKPRRGTSAATEALPANEYQGASVAEKLEQSLPPVDINLVSDGKTAEHEPQPMFDELRQALDDRKPDKPTRQARPSRRRAESEPIDLDPEFLRSPDKMNYALLLALLLREGGVVRLSATDLERTGDEQHILFALSLDGKWLEVSVVSNASGIIRPPEAKWAPNQNPAPYAPPPRPGLIEFNPEQALAALEAASPQPVQTQPRGDPARIVEMPQSPPRFQGTPPAPQQPAAAAAGTGYVFPFETGQSPMNLDALQSELQKDRTVELEQSRAAQRLEGQG